MVYNYYYSLHKNNVYVQWSCNYYIPLCVVRVRDKNRKAFGFVIFFYIFFDSHAVHNTKKSTHRTLIRIIGRQYHRTMAYTLNDFVVSKNQLGGSLLCPATLVARCPRVEIFIFEVPRRSRPGTAEGYLGSLGAAASCQARRRSQYKTFAPCRIN